MCRIVTSVEHFYWVSFNLLLDFDINEDCVPTSKSHMELDSISENRLTSFHVIFLHYCEDLKATVPGLDQYSTDLVSMSGRKSEEITFLRLLTVLKTVARFETKYLS